MDISKISHELSGILDSLFQRKRVVLDKLIDQICESLESQGKILVFGNGGSASQAQHFAAEVVNKFLLERDPLPAVSLTTDTSILTSVANDLSFDVVFSKQIEALGHKGDVALGLSTSGNSRNVLHAFQAARKKGLITAALTGEGGGKIGSLADHLLDVPSIHTPRIQEVHLVLLHIIAGEIERKNFS